MFPIPASHYASMKGFTFFLLQGLSRRGLHRPALEVGKLLLAMDERDPMGALPPLPHHLSQTNQCILRIRCRPVWPSHCCLAVRHIMHERSTAFLSQAVMFCWAESEKFRCRHAGMLFCLNDQWPDALLMLLLMHCFSV